LPKPLGHAAGYRRAVSQDGTPSASVGTAPSRARFSVRSPPEMEFGEVIRQRHMTRTYDPRPLASDVLDRILDAGRSAPSAGFTQGVTFLVLASPPGTARFWRHVGRSEPLPGGRWDRLRAAPVLVLPLADPQAYLDRYAEPDKAAPGVDSPQDWAVPYWELDAAFATMAMLLAAADERVGALFFAVAHGTAAMMDEFGAPPTMRLIGALALGYPGVDEAHSPSRSRARRPRDDVVRWGEWDTLPRRG
jgi:nitroreductase